MRSAIALSALAAVLIFTPVVAGYAPASGQDFSITNQAELPHSTRRDVMRQLQAWWDLHAYYPRHASNSDEAGTVRVHLAILPDGRIWTVDVVGSAGSPTLDEAGAAVFRGGFVRPFPAGEPRIDVDIPLHYVLAHRRDGTTAGGPAQPLSTAAMNGLAAQLQVALKSGDMAAAARLSSQLNSGLAAAPEAQSASASAGAANAADTKARAPFTITNDPVKSPILETMLQRTCTGTIIKNGIVNHPAYGMHSWAQAVFFRKPDGTPWVNFYEGGYPVLAPVTQVGKMVQWTGRQEHLGGNDGMDVWRQYTVWSDGGNRLTGTIGSRMINRFGVVYNTNVGGTAEFTCATEVLPTVTWNNSLAQSTATSPLDLAPGDPP